MVWLVPMLFGIQALCSCTAAPPAGGAAAALLSPRCNDPAVEEAADLVLRQINADREEGYILSLYRISSAREQPQEITGSVFYLILDVIDTECHVLSKKLWKNCKTRPSHSTVYGQCKAIIYINQARNIAHLNTYECTLQPVPPRYIWSVCPDCPVDDNPTKPEYLDAALQSLAKFNEESEQTHYFSVLNVTRASMQWVIGPAYFVEFLIQETSCSKNDTVADISMCEPLPSEVATSTETYRHLIDYSSILPCSLQTALEQRKHLSNSLNSYLEIHEQRREKNTTQRKQIGFCKGSVVNSRTEKFVTISCEIYSQQDPATEEEKQEANHASGESSQNQEASPSEANPFCPHLEKTMGWVRILPPSNEDINFHSLRESQKEHKDGKPVPPKAVGSTPSFDGEKTQVNKPDLTKPATGPVILPFPEEPSLSDSCPGEAKQMDAILHPLITRKPTTV